MVFNQSFYDLLGVRENTDIEEVKEHARRNLDNFREQVEQANDPEAEERKLITAYEVLNDPKERYFYELYGHEEYIQYRLDEDDLPEIEPTSESSGIKQIFGAGDDGGSGMDKSDSIADNVTKFGISKSPLAQAPGIRHEDYNLIASAGYVIGLVLMIGGIGYLLPSGNQYLAVTAIVAFVIGAGMTYIMACYGLDRRIWTRTAMGGVIPVVFLALPMLNLFQPVPGLVLPVVVGSVWLAGVMAANSYIEATRNRLREKRKGGASLGGDNFTETGPKFGAEDDSIPAKEILETFTEEYTSTTSAPAQDLVEESKIHSTRHFVPERRIKRRLVGTDTKHEKEVPVSTFSGIENKLRHDVHERDNHRPDRFLERTYEYLIPESVEEHTCPKCSGRTMIRCSNCSGHGDLYCGKCDGDTKYECRKCRGSGRIEVDSGNYSDCNKCGGAGYIPCEVCNATGTVDCSHCGGQGEVTCNRCEGDGEIIQYTELMREYEPEKNIKYVSKSIPEKYLTDASGDVIEKSRHDKNAGDPSDGALFMTERETREIPTDIVTYEYAGGLYEMYKIEDEVKAPTYPIELGGRVKAFAGLSILCLGIYVFTVSVGQNGLPVG